MKIIAYTAICGLYDTLKYIRGKNQNIEYWLFTDHPELYPTKQYWTYLLKNQFNDNKMNAKEVKICPHRYAEFNNCDVSIYYDGKKEVLKDLYPLVEMLGDNDILLTKHRARDCAYQEMSTMIEMKKCKDELIYKQQDKYRSENYPEHFGLYEGSVLIRRHNERTKKFNELWWSDIYNYSKRDQISYPHALYNCPELKTKILNWDDIHTPFFKSHGHRKLIIR